MSGPGIPWSTVEDAIHDCISDATGIVGSSVIWNLQGDQRPPTPFVGMRVMTILRQGIDWTDYTDAPLTFAAKTVTAVDTTADTLTCVGHGLAQGDGPIQVTSSGAVPAGLAALTNYWIVPVDADHFKLASTFQNAWVPITVDITSAGSGTIQVVAVVATRKAGAELSALSRGMRRVTVSVQCYGGNAEGSASPTALLDAVVSALPRRAALLRAAGVGVMQTSGVSSTDGTINATVLEPRATLTLTLSLKSEVQDPDTYIERVVATPTVDGVVETPVTWVLP